MREKISEYFYKPLFFYILYQNEKKSNFAGIFILRRSCSKVNAQNISYIHILYTQKGVYHISI